ncbi:hypothetical protein N1851_032758 [Merluccius polli]|uniref:Reverse transcriptase n=1 Tax=Merluccius polli TaxID=89951 RepID=A0AA47M2L6_MERPO|nr:hypothetical protein N1851_032758 [Merluccius polli]
MWLDLDWKNNWELEKACRDSAFSHRETGCEKLKRTLNTFYARFEANSVSADTAGTAASATEAGNLAGEDHPLSISEHDMRKALRRVNSRRAAGPDGIPRQVLKSCAEQLAPVFTSIVTLSLAHSVISKCFKTSTIITLPKKTNPSCFNDYRSVALTSAVRNSLDPLQFAYRPNKSTDVITISHVLHCTISHLDIGKGNSVHLLYMDYSLAFHTIVPLKLVTKLRDLGLSSLICSWLQSLLTDRPQVVTVGTCTTMPSNPQHRRPPPKTASSTLLCLHL